MDTLIRFSSVSIFLSLSARVALSFDTSDSRVSADDRCGSGSREKPYVNNAALMAALQHYTATAALMEAMQHCTVTAALMAALPAAYIWSDLANFGFTSMNSICRAVWVAEDPPPPPPTESFNPSCH